MATVHIKQNVTLPIEVRPFDDRIVHIIQEHVPLDYELPVVVEYDKIPELIEALNELYKER